MSNVNDPDRDMALNILERSRNLIEDLLSTTKDEDYLLIREEFLTIYRNYRSDLYEIIDKKFSDLIKEVDNYYLNKDLRAKLEANGLTGTELQFKSEIFNIFYNKIYDETDNNESATTKPANDDNNKSNKKEKKDLRQWFQDKIKRIVPGRASVTPADDDTNKSNKEEKKDRLQRFLDKLRNMKNIPGKAADYIDDIKDGLSAVNTILGSFGLAGLPTGAIDEVKEFTTRILKRKKDK